jgi:hypothetical protein
VKHAVSVSALVLATLMATAFGPDDASAQPAGVNYDESKVGSYTLPDPLVCADGTTVTDARTWREKRRPEILELFRTYVYGRSPASPATLVYERGPIDTKALGGKATRREVRIYLDGKRDGLRMTLLLYVPNGSPRPVPAFLGMNFDGNHTISPDPGITITEQWTWDAKEQTDRLVKPAEGTRGESSSRWPLETILARGYAVATVARVDVEPDYATGWKHGLRAALGKDGANTEWKGDDWGAIAAWAWGLSRALDYLETDKAVDAGRVALVGHSRLGKAALWAGAEDERFALVISNDSGEGGAALARRNFGETVERINTSFPHWFCANFKKYNQDARALPVDQHELLALIAPRPLYVASAEEDAWADPKGEFLSAKHAEPVYRLFGKSGLGVTDWPQVNRPVGDAIGYHLRTGKHDVTEYDWARYLEFADRHFKQPPR